MIHPVMKSLLLQHSWQCCCKVHTILLPHSLSVSESCAVLLHPSVAFWAQSNNHLFLLCSGLDCWTKKKVGWRWSRFCIGNPFT